MITIASVLPYSTWTYSKPIKDRLQRLFTGRGLYWGFPDDLLQKRRDQMGGERLKQKTLPNGKTVHEWVEVGRAGTHLRDCECMILVGAIADRLMGGRVPCLAASGFHEGGRHRPSQPRQSFLRARRSRDRSGTVNLWPGVWFLTVHPDRPERQRHRRDADCAERQRRR